MANKHSKLKVLYTIPNFDTAGSGKVLYDLAKGLNKDLFEISIACKNSKGMFFEEVKALGLPIYFLDPTVPVRPYYKLFSRINTIKQFIKKHNFDIVHSWHWSSDWTEVLASRFAGAKFVYTKKAMTWGNIHWKIRSFLSDFIITVNKEMRNYFPYKKNQKLIPFGIGTISFNPQLYPKKQQNSIFRLITVANLIPVKGIEVLIKAIHLIDNTSIKLDVLGDDSTSYGAILKKQVIDLKLENQITFLGKHNDVRPFLAKADLYIISSKKEGMPMALVEAMAMGIPVLGSDISGINYVLKDFQHLLFECSNFLELKDKINSIYKKTYEEREKIGQELRNYCISNYSMEKFIQEHEDLYSNLIL